MNSYSESTTTLSAVLQHSCEEGQSVTSDYWNIDDILAEEEPVPVEFLMDCKGLAHLNEVNNIAATSAQ